MTSHQSHPFNPNSRSPVPLRRIRRDNVSPNMAEKVPLVIINDNKPPIAGPESDDDLNDDREVVTKPYPGVDDGFFNSEGPTPNPDDITPTITPRFGGDDDVPVITSRAGEGDDVPETTPRTGPEGGSEKPDEVDGSGKNDHLHPNNFPGRYPYAPSFGRDPETGSALPDLESIPDLNVYQHKKTLAQGMMDLALFSANANQLRYVLESFSRHPYYYPSMILLAMSLLLQVGIGVGLIWNATYNVKDEKEICIANKINNFTVIGIFLVTVINVFISAFGVANTPTV